MGFRHVQIIFAWLATIIGYILRADMSVAVIAMTDKKPNHENATNDSWNVRVRKSTFVDSEFRLYSQILYQCR